MSPKSSGLPWPKPTWLEKLESDGLKSSPTLPRDEAQDWRVFKNTLTPLFADADKRDDAKKAYSRLAGKGCLVHSAQGLRHYGRDFLTAWNDMGEGRTVTEEGAMQAFLKGLPWAAKSVVMITKNVNPGEFTTLNDVVQNTMKYGVESMKHAEEMEPDRPVAQGNKRHYNDGAETSDQGARRVQGGVKKPKQGKGQNGWNEGARKKAFNGKGKGRMYQSSPPMRPDSRSEAELLADDNIRGYTNKNDGKIYSPELAQVLIEAGKCLGCGHKGHRLADCPSPHVPDHVKAKYAANAKN